MSDIQKLLKEVKNYYKTEGRAHLPWRKTRNPYFILVSEVMLQQTQVDRVLPFYKNFLQQFPTMQALAQAPLNKVLLAWQGLGYNRRGRFLQLTAKAIIEKNQGKFPKTIAELEALPGVGPYTARAVATFAYNKPEVFIETNIRTIFIYFCFPHANNIDDKKILPLVAEALQKSNMEPRDFYAALMDYGTFLKKQGIKLNKQSKQYTKQSTFIGSARQLRGAILRELLQKPQTSLILKKKLFQQFNKSAEEVVIELERLQKEKLITKRSNEWHIS